jgi:hypothetical protein
MVVKKRRCNDMREKRIKAILNGMKTRCNNPNAKDYKNYGGRGVQVCSEWSNDTSSFVKWSLENGYTDELTIDRIDVNGNYEPSNCRWITMKEQSNNRTTSRFVTINGVTKTMQEWSDESGVPKNTILQRIKMGWEGTKLIEPAQGEMLTVKGETKSIGEWSKETGINSRTIRARALYYGWAEEDWFLPPSQKKYKDRKGEENIGQCQD